jgi:hypothetical protein
MTKQKERQTKNIHHDSAKSKLEGKKAVTKHKDTIGKIKIVMRSIAKMTKSRHQA